MEKVKLEEEIKELLLRGHEGGYWDYKSDYADCPEDKLMDYICMANNLEGRDAYLIYGVDNDGKIIGIENTSYKRCNTKEINEFLRNKPFAGGYIPSISVDVLLLEGHELDVVTIKNTNKTPYYLTKNYNQTKEKMSKTLKAGAIYTRVNDQNTPRELTANMEHTEYLWRKRFGIDMTPSEKLMKLLNLEYVDSNRNLVQYIKRSRQNLLFMAQEELEDNLREQDETVKQELQKKLDDINSQIDRLNYVKESLNCVNEELKGMTSNDEQMAVAFSSADTQVEELLANLEITYSAIRGKMHIGGDGRNNQVYLASWVAKQKIERSKERVTFFAVEEPEAHLHPHQQRQLSKYLASNFSEQIFITTHSAQIASEFLPDRMVCLYKTNNAVHAAQGGCCSKLKIVFDDFGYRLNAVSAELFFSNGVFLVEGPSEKIFYFAMDKIFGLELDKKNINVIDVNGVGFKPYIKVCEALNIPFVMRTDNDIFKVPWTNKFHYAGVSRVMGIYKEILSRKNEKLLEYWEENESKSKWECDAAEHNEADIIRDYISQAMMKYGIYLSDVDLETDIANSFLYDSLSEFYGITDKTMLIKEMQKRKAENMLSYMEACIEKKMSFSELKGDKLLLPIYQLIDKARRNTYGK